MELKELLAHRTQFSQPDEKRQMIDLAASMNDVISLGRGDPDLVTPSTICDAAIDAIRHGATGYTKWPGIPELRKAIADNYSNDRNVPVQSDEVLVTVGAQEAVFLTMLAFVNPGDEIILIEPRYMPYDIAIQLVGGKIVSVPASAENDFVPDISDIEKAITTKTKAILLVSPNNPTGTILPLDFLKKLAKTAVANDLMVISDELYSGLVYEDSFAHSIAALDQMKDRTVIINGFSKSFSMTGWRVGYLIASADVVKVLTQMKSATTICAPQPSQYAALKAAREGHAETLEITRVYNERREAVITALDEMGVPYARPKGAFYVFANIAAVYTGSSFEFTKEFLKRKKVLVFPGTIFGPSGEGHIRISLLENIDAIKEAMKRLSDFVAETKEE